MESIERIKKLIKGLPKSDQYLGKIYLETRSFKALSLLVDSTLYRVRQSLKLENPPRQEYLEVDLTELSNLKAEVDLYLTRLELAEGVRDEDPMEDDCPEEEY